MSDTSIGRHVSYVCPMFVPDIASTGLHIAHCVLCQYRTSHSAHVGRQEDTPCRTTVCHARLAPSPPPRTGSSILHVSTISGIAYSTSIVHHICLHCASISYGSISSSATMHQHTLVATQNSPVPDLGQYQT
eukprot:3846971-Rhodomonas_salina.2